MAILQPVAELLQPRDEIMCTCPQLQVSWFLQITAAQACPLTASHAQYLLRRPEPCQHTQHGLAERSVKTPYAPPLTLQRLCAAVSFERVQTSAPPKLGPYLACTPLWRHCNDDRQARKGRSQLGSKAQR